MTGKERRAVPLFGDTRHGQHGSLHVQIKRLPLGQLWGNLEAKKAGFGHPRRFFARLPNPPVGGGCCFRRGYPIWDPPGNHKSTQNRHMQVRYEMMNYSPSALLSLLTKKGYGGP